MWTANNPISHYTSHTLDNGASSSNNGDGAHPIRHHTSHTLENGASSSNKGAYGDGENSNDNGGSRSSYGSVVSLLFIQDTIRAVSWKPP
jgi:hypothetical protein